MGTPVIDLRAPGTQDAIWERWRADCAPLTVSGWRELVVVAPHPDDEVLGVGGLIALARANGIPVTVVAATDGEASHPDSPTHTRDRLTALRIKESHAAATELGAEPPLRLHLPDGDLTRHEHDLTERLSILLARPGGEPVWCAASWAHDGHPDHEAVGRAAAAACARTGARLLQYPIWMWHWATPANPLLEHSRARTLALPPAAHSAKCRALSRFRSQTQPLSDLPGDEPILPQHILRRFTGPTETFLL
ncbi:PIG-L family deacetylase [Nocardia sp. NPDC005978]|uniref:PIG-L deacetylase family protein n=1 Tax=Nocardia sp. NPDC005978 TaxID=3156725 RepID=UPI0033A69BBD